MSYSEYTDDDLAADTATPISYVDPLVAAKLSEACAAYRKMADEKGALEAAMKLLLPDIAKLAEQVGSDKIRGNGWLLLNVESGRSDIDAKKLLEKGVSLEVVNAATVRRTWKSWQVRDSK